MGRRGKLKLQLVSDPKARRKLFERRKKTVEKAGTDLSTLCGIDIGMIFVYSPHDLLYQETTTWSSGRNKRQRQQVLRGLVASFRAPSSSKKTSSVADFINENTVEEEDEEEEEDDDDDEEQEKKLDRAGLTAKMEAVRGRLNMFLSGELVDRDESALQLVCYEGCSDEAMMMIEYTQPSTL